jgi:ParB-like chromosome segregation protein Spo0J
VLKIVPIKLDDIYVPTGLRKELDEDKVSQAAEDMMDGDEAKPIQVRQGKDRYVLVKGLHRVEAAKALGDETIEGIVVAARKH